MTPRCAAAAAGLLVVGSLLAGCTAPGTATGTATGAVAAHAAPDEPIMGPQGRVAQFLATCGVSHYGFDDPIVHPGHAGASHQHVFFGNSAVSATSTLDELLAADTTCDQRLDTASYWTPVLLGADGRRVDPIDAIAYYRPGAEVDPTSLVPYPTGLMMVAGDALAERPQPLSIVAWSCGVSAVRSVEPTRCPARSTLRLLVTFPDCWDGDRLRPVDVDDVSSHVAYSSTGACPASHPVAMPQLQLAIDHPPVDPDGLALSSGTVLSAHADFWNAWDEEKLAAEVTGCLHRGIVCGVTANRHP